MRASSSSEREDLVGGRLEDVDPAKPVHLQVDETGDGEPRRPAGEADRRDAPVVDLDVATHELAVDDSGSDTQSHARSVTSSVDRVARVGTQPSVTHPSFDLTGRCAVVTGASSGIGQAIALALAEAGADIVGLSLDDGAATAAGVSDRGRRSLQLVGDTSIPADLERTADAALETFGRLDIWVNNAARPLVKPFLETTEDDWHDLLAVNLFGYVWGCRAAARTDGRCRRAAASSTSARQRTSSRSAICRRTSPPRAASSASRRRSRSSSRRTGSPSTRSRRVQPTRR